jgi:hypothetical protein
MNLQARRNFINMTLKRVKPGSGSTVQFLKARTWNRPVTNLKQFIDVPYVIVGGVATRLYMPERITDDLGILVHASEEERAYAALLGHGSRQLGDLSIGGAEYWRCFLGVARWNGVRCN